MCKDPTKSLPQGQIWLESAILVSSIAATGLYSDSTCHPRICNHFVNRPQIFVASFANDPQFTCEKTDGLQVATFPELRLSRFLTLCFKYSTILPGSIPLLDILGHAFEFKVTLQALQVEGQRTVPVATKSCFAPMTPLLKEEPAAVRHIAPIPTLFQVCPNTELRVTLATTLFENNCADLLSCKFCCNSKPYTHCFT